MPCFSFIYALVEPYVKKVQVDKRVVPFIYTELKSLRDLLQLVVNSDVLDRCKTGLQMALGDQDLEGNLLPLSDAELGFVVKAIIIKG